ncbi:MAG: M23 family metallopeptidase [Bacillota bacterium]
MADRKQTYTVMVIPHSEQPSTSFTLRLFQVQLASLCLIALFLSLLVFANLHHNLQANMAELEELRMVNREQRQQIEYLAAETETLQDTVRSLLELDRQIREMVRLDRYGTWPSTTVQVRTSPALPPLDATTAGLRLTLPTRSAVTQPVERALAIRAANEELKDQFAAIGATLTSYRTAASEDLAYQSSRPSIPPAVGFITSPFGVRTSPFGWGVQFHSGIDIAARDGTPIVATGDGRVTFVGWKSSYGRTVELEHGYGYATLYGHCSKVIVSVGQKVKKGTVIAYMGSTGQSTGPHVHYEVRVNGKLVNPRTYMN